MEQDARLSRQGADDLVFYDGSRPYRCWFPHGDRQLVLAVPGTKLIARLPKAGLLVSRTLGQDSALGKLANAMINVVLGTTGSHDTPGMRRDDVDSAILSFEES